MQFSVHERFNGREVTTGKGKSCELLYVVLGTPEAGDNARDLDADALAALTSAAATTLAVDGETLVRTKRHIEPLLRWDVDAAGQPGGTMIWDGSATYQRFDWTPPEVGQSTFSFDTGGGTQHITQAIATVASYPQGAPSFQGAIGVTHDSVEGVDITVPVYSFSETHYNSLAFVTESYKQTLFGLTGKVNNAAFKGFAAGEVLFLGASGSKRGDEDHGYADIADGDTAKLASGTSGAYILWKEAGAGTKWAIVRLGTYAGESGSAQIRRARAQENSPADQYLSVKLLDASGNPVGAAFDATEVNGRVFTSLNPNVLTGDDLLVAQVDDTWYVLNFTPSQSSQGNVVRVTITGVGGVYTWIEAQLHDGTPITLYNVNGNPWQDLLPNLKNTTNRNKCFALNVGGTWYAIPDFSNVGRVT